MNLRTIGSFASASCIECKQSIEIKDIEIDIFSKTVPWCPKCPEEVDGIIKPNITFFGEKLPDYFEDSFSEDKEKVDLLIVMGSSLKVSPVADVKDKIPHHVPQILINMESLAHMNGFDVQLLGKCDVIVAELCKKLGWDLDVSSRSSSGVGTSNDVADASLLEKHAEKKEEVYEYVSPNIYLFEGAKVYEDSDEDDALVDRDDDDEANESELENGPGLSSLYDI